MKTAVVAGALANKPGNGGEAWVRMGWARGLARLGFDVWFVEALEGGPARFELDPAMAAASADGRDGASESGPIAFFDHVTRANGFGARRALWIDGELWGTTPDVWDELGDRCDLLINISGHLSAGEWFHRVPHRVYVDLDPGYTHIWHAQGLLEETLERHTSHYTVGLNIGTDSCPLPTGDVDWRPTLQPVVLDDWPAPVAGGGSRTSGAPLRFTTVASWRGAFGPMDHNGHVYGTKAHEWRRFRELPGLLPAHRFEAALAIHDGDGADRDALEAAGWCLEDPTTRASTQAAFREYLATSDAEFSVAQGTYVASNSGWFSDRSARYLAAGRPVLVQDTGFGSTLPEGEGVLAFATLEDAARGAERIAAEYPAHARAARRLAESHFDSDRVLGRILDDLGLRT